MFNAIQSTIWESFFHLNVKRLMLPFLFLRFKLFGKYQNKTLAKSFALMVILILYNNAGYFEARVNLT